MADYASALVSVWAVALLCHGARPSSAMAAAATGTLWVSCAATWLYQPSGSGDEDEGGARAPLSGQAPLLWAALAAHGVACAAAWLLSLRAEVEARRSFHTLQVLRGTQELMAGGIIHGGAPGYGHHHHGHGHGHHGHGHHSRHDSHGETPIMTAVHAMQDLLHDPRLKDYQVHSLALLPPPPPSQPAPIGWYASLPTLRSSQWCAPSLPLDTTSTRSR